MFFNHFVNAANLNSLRLVFSTLQYSAYKVHCYFLSLCLVFHLKNYRLAIRKFYLSSVFKLAIILYFSSHKI